MHDMPMALTLSHMLARPLALRGSDGPSLVASALMMMRGALGGPVARIEAAARPARQRPYEAHGGVAHIRVRGMLVDEWPYYEGYEEAGLVTSYDRLMGQMIAAAQDPAVGAILLDINSGGGMVDGLYELVDAMAALGQRATGKPLWASCVHAYSAAYALASAADRVLVAESGGVGSVGVITLHADYSRALEEFGVKVTVLRAGERKAETNPYEPLSDAARAGVQAEIDGLREGFIARVARGRGLSQKAVRDTQARTLTAAEGVAAGFADEVAPQMVAFARLAEKVRRKAA